MVYRIEKTTRTVIYLKKAILIRSGSTKNYPIRNITCTGKEEKINCRALCNKKECIKSSIKKQIKVISSYGVELRKQNIPISQTLEIYCFAVADSSYIETDDAQGGTNIVLDVADQPVKHQNKMLVIILGIGILAIGVIAILAIKRKQRK